MGTRELIDVGSDGVVEYAHFDSDGNFEGLEWIDDVGSIIENNKLLQNDGSGGYGKTREWKRIASIPVSLCRQWEVEMGLPVDFLQSREGFHILIKKCKDPDYRYLRTDK